MLVSKQESKIYGSSKPYCACHLKTQSQSQSQSLSPTHSLLLIMLNCLRLVLVGHAKQPPTERTLRPLRSDRPLEAPTSARRAYCAILLLSNCLSASVLLWLLLLLLSPLLLSTELDDDDDDRISAFASLFSQIFTTSITDQLV